MLLVAGLRQEWTFNQCRVADMVSRLTEPGATGLQSSDLEAPDQPRQIGPELLMKLDDACR